MKNKVSIIIPVYNCEKFLDKCLDSLINQTYNDIEIILVNDGSTDRSLEICRKYEKKDTRVKVIDQKNGGVSSARNSGLAEATGEYILFVDGDDYIEYNCIEKSMDLILEKELDILKFSFLKELSKKITKKYTFSVELNTKILKEEYTKKLYKYMFSTNDFCNTTNAIIKRNIIKDTKFPLNRLIGEDYWFFVQCLNNSNNIYFINDAFYHYIVNADSATHIFNEEKNAKKLADSIFVNTEIRNDLLSRKYDDYQSYIDKCNYNIFSNLQVCILNANYKKFKEYIDRIKNDEYLSSKIIEFEEYLSKEVKLLLNKDKKMYYICKAKNLVNSYIKKFASKIK